MVTLSSMFPFVRIKISQSYNPDVAVTTPVWAISFSLATTREIGGSTLFCKSPQLFAAYHVFLRLQEPRHPPYALAYFLFASYPSTGQEPLSHP